MNLKEMNIKQITETDLFKENAKKLLDLLWESRIKAKMKAANRNQMLKAHPIDTLKKSGDWEIETFPKAFIAVLDKESKHSANCRQYINEVGTNVLMQTIKKMQEDEKAKDGDNGAD